MKYIITTLTLLTIGCVTEHTSKTVDEYVPSPPKQIINYKGHGTEYTTSPGHVNHHKHHSYHGHGGTGYHND